ncbi:hypothetical protein NECAME_07102 [Necator americanus]|uniref:Uncharacterized protein n=1 Tax=Necator americanus TaxID=51031 RepID=W2TSB2_NECAM|nr:hypothetical protein NECAME_07102 [Necator americanus]ETN84006.1 hypothetical protein NECAME_07102 [Necator americanus]
MPCLAIAKLLLINGEPDLCKDVNVKKTICPRNRRKITCTYWHCLNLKVFLYRLSAKPCERGREFLVSCDSCCSTLAYQLKSFKRQAPLGGFKTLSLLRAVVKVFNEPVIFLFDVVHCGIFPKAG